VSSPPAVAAALSAAFLDGPWSSAAELAERGARAIGISPRRALPIAKAVRTAYREPPVDRRRELTRYVEDLASYKRLWRRGRRPVVAEHRLPVTAMAANRWHVPQLDTVAALAAWAGLTTSQLDWYADNHSLERRADARLRHYDRTWVYSKRGAVRLLEQPRPRLKALQRRMLHDLLDPMPVHDAAHGFVAGRSVLTYAAAHVGRDVVVRLDLEAFFAAITPGRAFGVFRLAGYPEPVAHALAGLASTVLPFADARRAPAALRDADLSARRRLLDRLARPHLPQGAPTSPALANLAAYRLDARLSGLAAALDARYTRYADDLAFSLTGTDAARRARRLVDAVRPVVAAEGFRVNEAKTRLATRGQRQLLCGVVVNERTGVARRERDELRAILHNCRRDGAQSQNRGELPDFRAHLLGRIAWVGAINPAHGERLRAQLDEISQW
jgi:hypothetical protein